MKIYLPLTRNVCIKTDINNPVVQLINSKTEEVIYTRRFTGNEVKLKVFEKGKYFVKMGESTEKLRLIDQKFRMK